MSAKTTFKTLAQAERDDSVDEDAIAYQTLEAERWPDGPICPHCGAVNHAYYLAPKSGVRTTRTGKTSYRRLWKCGKCRKQFSVLMGTIFADSPVPLSKWRHACDLLRASERTITIMELADVLHVTYRTARSMRERIQASMPQPAAAQHATHPTRAKQTEWTEELVQTIYRALVAAGERGLTRTEIYRDVCKGRVTHEAISQALYWEIAEYLGTWTEEDSGGRPTDRWHANEFSPWRRRVQK